MLKKVVGTVSVLSVTICILGMGYPQEKEKQKDTANVIYATAVTDQLAANIMATQNRAKSVQEQGAKSIARYADGEARIQAATMPLVRSEVEAAKRKTSLTQEELLLLQKVVSAEARGESSEAQYTVACVVLNRIESGIFPDSLEEVITQDGQFSCVENGAIYHVPITDSVVQAVDMALDNNTLDQNVMWFRSSHYHRFHKKAFQIGELFFSKAS